MIGQVIRGDFSQISPLGSLVRVGLFVEKYCIINSIQIVRVYCTLERRECCWLLVSYCSPI